MASSLREAHFSAEDLAQLLKTGRSAHYSVSGPMADVISHSTQHLTDDDRAAIGEYLVAIADQPVVARSTNSVSREAGQGAAGTYASLCSVCHGREGEGVEFVVPALAGNPTVLADDSSSLLQVLLNGTHSPRTQEQMGYAMPGYGWRLDDGKLAELANYLRSQWGNQATAVSAADVAALRGQTRAH